MSETKNAPIVLHVDDDEDIREIVKLTLEMVGGMTVVQCSSGSEALNVVEDAQPDLFLLDLMMPGMTGLQTLLELRKKPGFLETPAFFLTAKAQEPEMEALREAGVASVICKPFDPMAVSAQLTEAYAAA